MARTLQDVQIQILTCTNCGLNSACNSPIPIHTQAIPNIRYLLIGEAPGKIEDLKGVPFTGPAGMFMRKALRRAGLRPTDGGYMNAVSCYPAETGTPTAAEVTACKHNLFAQLDVTETPYVLVVGSIALTSLLPNAQLSSAMGGPIEVHGKQLFPVYHPSYILRAKSREILALWDRHLRRFAEMVEGREVTRDTLQIINCAYCSGQRMNNSPVCIRCEGQFEKDKMRPKFKYAKPPQLELWEE